VSAVGNAHEFKSGRELSAYLGLVPCQYSSRNRNLLLGSSKRGDLYLRTLLIHGAGAALCRVDRKSDWRSVWASRIKLRRGFNMAAVALVNKNARVIWACSRVAIPIDARQSRAQLHRGMRKPT
jgi:transposase